MHRLEQRCTALAATFAFVIATIAIPTVHLVVHTIPHDHAAGEIHYHGELPPHDHGDAGHHHHGEADHGEPEQPADPRHGEGSAAHFSLAISDDAASPLSLSLSGLFLAGRVLPAPRLFPALAHVSVQRFRGPPAIG